MFIQRMPDVKTRPVAQIIQQRLCRHDETFAFGFDAKPDQTGNRNSQVPRNSASYPLVHQQEIGLHFDGQDNRLGFTRIEILA